MIEDDHTSLILRICRSYVSGKDVKTIGPVLLSKSLDWKQVIRESKREGVFVILVAMLKTLEVDQVYPILFYNLEEQFKQGVGRLNFVKREMWSIQNSFLNEDISFSFHDGCIFSNYYYNIPIHRPKGVISIISKKSQEDSIKEILSKNSYTLTKESSELNVHKISFEKMNDEGILLSMIELFTYPQIDSNFFLGETESIQIGKYNFNALGIVKEVLAYLFLNKVFRDKQNLRYYLDVALIHKSFEESQKYALLEAELKKLDLNDKFNKDIAYLN